MVEERILQEVVHSGFNGRLRKVVTHQGERLLSDIEAKGELSKRISKHTSIK
ncbi:hypothetical protein Xbed_01132 [Xenorhabdus beddingii]|uniref:Uncharacterized protein n=1 Tax=Xenorhabdus beddingii TaxID=40578 RepID=A0A1Y2SSV2_9GAMM|nr:hypothetical protein [Xenorhabdus beddingii]OTA20873.1 hypothetical protein Xbed_01132 [Xenorhabdus beddingii]